MHTSSAISTFQLMKVTVEILQTVELHALKTDPDSSNTIWADNTSWDWIRTGLGCGLRRWMPGQQPAWLKRPVGVKILQPQKGGGRVLGWGKGGLRQAAGLQTVSLCLQRVMLSLRLDRAKVCISEMLFSCAEVHLCFVVTSQALTAVTCRLYMLSGEC